MSSSKIYASFNREITLLDELKISVNDRAFFFGDGVYEVLRVYYSQPLFLDEHLARLKRSLGEVHIEGVPDLRNDILANIALNDIHEGMVYLQISRGSAHRLHSFHNAKLTPNILIYSTPFHAHPCAHEATTGIRAITHEDLRWGRVDIKTVNLLANCMAQSYAHKMGAQEAILVKNNFVTEGSTCNVFIVKNHVVKTPPLSRAILPGTRRQFLLHALRDDGYDVREENILTDELYNADEVFITSTVKEAIAVVKIDQKIIRDGSCGPVSLRARELILEAARPLRRPAA